MAVMQERPYSGSNFLVTIGEGDNRSVAAGFAEVIFPPFASSGQTGHHLVLRRGVIGSVDLYAWWDETRREQVPATRPVTVELLGDDRRTVVLTWRFHRAYPVSVSYSPLRAVEGGVVMETVELAFERVEME